MSISYEQLGSLLNEFGQKMTKKEFKNNLNQIYKLIEAKESFESFMTVFANKKTLEAVAEVENKEVFPAKKKGRGRPRKKNQELVVQVPDMDKTEPNVEVPVEVIEKSLENPVGEIKEERVVEVIEKNVKGPVGEVPEKDEPKQRKPRNPKELIDLSFWISDGESFDDLSFTRMIHNDGEKTNKYWEHLLKENKVLIRYGKVGGKGTLQQKSFETNQDAEGFLTKEIRNKEKKGYSPQ